MCLILFAYKAIPELTLVVAANRDELYERPTEQAGFWDSSGSVSSESELLAGKDLQAGGTWLGFTRSGRFAAVTNIRDPYQIEKRPKSRGELTHKFLTGDMTAETYSRQLRDEFSLFAGYNLLVSDGCSLWYVNNFEEIIKPLQPGIYGLSNGLLDSDWPKINSGKKILTSFLGSPSTLTTDMLIHMMSNREIAADELLPKTGVSLEIERALSPMFIANPQRQYGTLCSTAIIAERGGAVKFSEQNYDGSGSRSQRHFYEFDTVSN